MKNYNIKFDFILYFRLKVNEELLIFFYSVSHERFMISFTYLGEYLKNALFNVIAI